MRTDRDTDKLDQLEVEVVRNLRHVICNHAKDHVLK